MSNEMALVVQMNYRPVSCTHTHTRARTYIDTGIQEWIDNVNVHMHECDSEGKGQYLLWEFDILLLCCVVEEYERELWIVHSSDWLFSVHDSICICCLAMNDNHQNIEYRKKYISKKNDFFCAGVSLDACHLSCAFRPTWLINKKQIIIFYWTRCTECRCGKKRNYSRIVPFSRHRLVLVQFAKWRNRWRHKNHIVTIYSFFFFSFFLWSILWPSQCFIYSISVLHVRSFDAATTMRCSTKHDAYAFALWFRFFVFF